MMMRSWFPIGLIAACCLVLSGCGPMESVHPLSSLDDAKIDQRLIGTWEKMIVESDDDERFSMEIKPISNHHMSLTMVERDSGEPDAKALRFFISQFNQTRIMNVQPYCPPEATDCEEEDADDKTGFIPMKYTVEGGTLTLYVLSHDAMEGYVETEEIQGTVHTQPTYVSLTDSTERLNTFFQHHHNDSNLYELLSEFKKVDGKSNKNASP